ncbi:sensor domain-containing protein [Alkalihalobacterium chitinilyticum]|uniref:EAL domain-containing protein n=1 Tax=Alkalihalobacterium chitinilyticum TaxID=2980103 RepID=A0ABT5VA63_9BACI|nr:GGDEF domain-containing phosphodiesterase [Alkalihalobacterium chitinilyticum]MDE5412353.1 EAL domain-containing protein [Alkalihalobacterium chitinilyticum]
MSNNIGYEQGLLTIFEKVKQNIEKLELNIETQISLQQLEDYAKVLNDSSILAVTDGNGIIIDVNDTFCKISQYSRSELIGKNHNVLKSGYHSKEFYKDLWETINSGSVWEGEIKNRRKDGTFYWVKTAIYPFLDEQGKPYKFISARTDITEGKKYEQQLRERLKNDFKHVVKNLHNLVFKVEKISGEFVITLFDGQLVNVLGLQNKDILNKSINEAFSTKIRNLAEGYFVTTFKTGENTSFEFDVNNRYYHVTLSPIHKDGAVTAIVGSVSELTELKQSELKIKHMAYHNHITDLPNRMKLIEDLKSELEKARKGKQVNLGVVLVDLDRFKQINDTAGHVVGDAVIVEVGKRFSDLYLLDLVEEVKLYHLGGDEFVFLIKSFDEEDVSKMISRLYQTIEQPFAYKNVDFYLTLSAGIGLSNKQTDDEEELLKQADLALLKAKDEGRNSCRIYTPKMNEELIRKIEIESDIRKALEREEFVLFFQPQLNLESNQMIGVEALIRWIHPTKGLVSPAEFIPVAEETGLIIPIGDWVLRKACDYLNEWKAAGIDNIKMSVNIATSHFKRRDFSENVLKILYNANVDGNKIELEINESSLMENTKDTALTLKKLRDHNIGISIDDFGTGYSSLGYLKSFPITTLKIDQSFVRDIMNNGEDRAIVTTIINLAKNLKLEVVAEGVETEEALTFLKSEHCDVMQGYYYSKPLPADQFMKFIN